jgi:hypothetical protein
MGGIFGRWIRDLADGDGVAWTVLLMLVGAFALFGVFWAWNAWSNKREDERRRQRRREADRKDPRRARIQRDANP